MPAIAKILPKGSCLPDYRGGSIVNLLASIIRSRGGRSPYRELRGLPARSLARCRNVVYLVVDGMGEEQLARHLAAGGGKGFLARHPRRVITSVFPATTAAAVTTFATGAAPAEHGILGWHLHLPDLGMVSTILPSVTRTGSPMAHPEFDLGEYLRLPGYLDSARGRRELISWRYIPGSRYSRAGGKWTKRRSYSTLAGMERQIAAFARGRGRGVAYAYWPEYDTLCHAHGCRHRGPERHLGRIDRSLARIVRRLRGMSTALIVTADHGLVDAPRGARVDLRDVPGLFRCLAMLPSGDARAVHCFVRPSKVRKFRSVVFQRLEKACVCVPGRQLLAAKVFGTGRAHPALEGRVGDFVLIAKGGYTFNSSLPGATPEFNEANHGGLSRAEVLVPLYVVPCDGGGGR